LLLALFCWIELHQPQPLIDLRLLKRPNFAFANIFNMTYGLILGYSYILPQYLGQIQGYNPIQVGSVLIWSSLVNPTTAKIIEHFETRLVIGIGTSLFITSCFITSVLDRDVAGHQLFWPQIIRALAQPLMGSAISYAATENIEKEQADNASAIYNWLRVVATTAANAGIGTLLTKREQFHSSILVDSVSMSNASTQERMQQLSSFFTGKMGDPVAAQSQAMKAIQQSTSQQAYILAFSDCFYVIGVAVILGAIFSIPFLKVKKPADVVSATNR
jgi:DHA2 family multidrug resistance protein